MSICIIVYYGYAPVNKKYIPNSKRNCNEGQFFQNINAQMISEYLVVIDIQVFKKIQIIFMGSGCLEVPNVPNKTIIIISGFD